MSLNIKNIYKESFRNISDDKELFFSTIAGLTIIFLIINIFTVFFVNLKKFNDYVRNNMQIKIYLQSDLTEEGKKDVLKNLLKYEEITNIKYVSKEIALKNLEENLQFQMDFSDNPLPDSVIINIHEDVNVEKLIEEIKFQPGVEGVDSKSEFLKKLNIFTSNIGSVIKYFYIVVAIPLFILVYHLTHMTILYRKEEIEIMSLIGATRWYIKSPFIIEALIGFFISGILSMLIFLPAYKFLRINFLKTLSIFNIASTFEVFYGILYFLITFGLPIIIAASYISVKKYIKLYEE